jgi:hypothetical protein
MTNTRRLVLVAALLGAAACSQTRMQTSSGDVELMPMNKPQVDIVELGVVPVQTGPGDAPMPAAMPTPAMKEVLDMLASFGAPPIEKSSPANAREAPTPKDAVMGVMAAKGQPPAVAMVGTPNRLELRGDAKDTMIFRTPSGLNGDKQATHDLVLQAGIGLTF